MSLTAAQNQREIDDASDAEIALAERRVAVGNDLYDAYFKGRPAAVEEIEFWLDYTDMENLLADLRDDHWRQTGKANSRLKKLVYSVVDYLVEDADDRRLNEIERWME